MLLLASAVAVSFIAGICVGLNAACQWAKGPAQDPARWEAVRRGVLGEDV